MIIQTPASTANLGPGFDSIGLAVSLALKVENLGESKVWQVDHQLKGLPHDENNLIVQAALKACPSLSPLHLKVGSNIPLAHGLGSSASAIVAGIELANQVARLHISKEKELTIAAKMEGHPDNAAPTIFGGLVVCDDNQENLQTEKLPAPKLTFIAYIPSYNLATKKARGILPQTLSFKTAVRASATANVLVAALAHQNYRRAGRLMERDLFHEPYRAKMIPELGQLRQIGHKVGAFATYLSGAGSTVMTMIEADKVQKFIDTVRAHNLNDRIEKLVPDLMGVQVLL